MKDAAPMTKQQEFLWIVQTVMLANNVYRCAREGIDQENATELGGLHAFILADEAVRASKRIPGNMSAKTAANQFLTYMLENWRRQEEDAEGKRLSCPHWFLRYGVDPEDD